MHSLWIQGLREAEHYRHGRESTTDAVQPLPERLDRARSLANLQAEDGARAQLVRTEAIGVTGRGEARVRRRDRRDCERRRLSARERSRSRMPDACGHVASGIRSGWRVAPVVSRSIRRARSSGRCNYQARSCRLRDLDDRGRSGAPRCRPRDDAPRCGRHRPRTPCSLRCRSRSRGTYSLRPGRGSRLGADRWCRSGSGDALRVTEMRRDRSLATRTIR